MKTITLSQEKILKALARYKYLTISLIDDLSIFKNKISIYRAIKPLKEGKKPLIIAHNFGVIPGKGQLESLLYLTKYGKELLIDLGIDENKMKIPYSKTLVTTDYFHRVRTISTFVYMDLYLKSTNNKMIFLDYYFDKGADKGKKFKVAKNRIQLKDSFFIPDIVTKFIFNDKKYLYLIEIHNGVNTNKIYTQFLNHIIAIENETPKQKYNHPRNNRVVIIFEFESCMNALIKKIQQEPKFKKFLKLFIFNTFDNIKLSFNEKWKDFNGDYCSFI